MAAGALEEREVLLQRLRDQAQARARSAVPSAPPPVAGPPAATLPTQPASIGPGQGSAPVGTPARPPAWLSINTILVGVGALLLAVAAIGFLIFSWQSIPLAGRAGVIAAATLTALGLAAWLRPRLPETAEAIGALAVVLVLGDGWAIRRTGLFGADRPDGMLYAAAAILVSGVLVEAWGRTGRVRAGTHAAAGLLPVGTFLLVSELTTNLSDLYWMLALVLGAAVTLTRRTLPAGWWTERVIGRSVAGLMLLSATVPAWFAVPDRNQALIAALAATLVTAAQTWAEAGGVRVAWPSPGAAQGEGGEPGAEGAGSQVFVPNQADARSRGAVLAPVRVNRVWSLMTGFFAAGTAAVAGAALAGVLNLTDTATLIPVTLLTGLVLVAVSRTTPTPNALLRRTALAIGVLTADALIFLPTLTLAIWQPFRPFEQAVRSVGGTTRFEDVGGHHRDLTEFWGITLACLVMLAAVTWFAGRRPRWPGGPWPRSIRHRLRQAPVVLLAASVVLLTLMPVAPVVVTVSALIAVSALASFLALRNAQNQVFWMTSWLSGILGVALAWTTRDLPGAATMLAALALLAARRRIPRGGHQYVETSLLLAVLASAAGVAAGYVIAGQFGADDVTALIWTALIGGLGSAALLTAPGLPIPGRPGRANWTAMDRFGAAAPGLGMLVFTIIQSETYYVAGDLADWARPAVLAVALLVAVSGALLINPLVDRAFPVLAPGLALSATPLLGLLVRASVNAWWPGTLSEGLYWSLATAAGALALTLLVLGAPAAEQRRRGAEIGLLFTGATATMVMTGSWSDHDVWLTLLILGVSATAIALTPDRAPAGWLAWVLLTACSWTRLADADVGLVEAYSVPPAVVLLVVQLWARRRHPRPPRISVPHSGPLELYRLHAETLRPLSIAVVPSVIACATVDQPARPIVLLVLAALVVGGARILARSGRLSQGSTDVAGLGAALVAGTAALFRVVQETDGRAAFTTAQLPLTGIEVWTIPAALIVLLHGWNQFPGLENRYAEARAEPGWAPSWAAFGPGLVLLLGPGLLCTLSQTEGPAARPFLVILAGAVGAVLGATRRLQAPLLLGAAGLAIEAIVLLAPWMREVGGAVPLWAWAALVGLVLLVLGGGYERRLAQLRTVRSRLEALR